MVIRSYCGRLSDRLVASVPVRVATCLLLMASTVIVEAADSVEVPPGHDADNRCIACREVAPEPENPAAMRVDRANSLQQAGQHADAVELYRQALALDPYYLPARVNLVTLYSRQGNVGAAQDLLEAGLKLPDAAPQDRGHLAYLLALSLAAQGEFEPALDWLDRDAAWRPTHARTYYNQALLLDRLGRKEEALAALDKGLYLSPESPDLLYAEVYLNATQGHVSQALAAMETLRRIAPDDPQLGRLEQQLKGNAPP